MKVLVTGGAGFIGSNVIRQLIADGVSNITVLDDLSSGSRKNLQGLDVEFLEGSILDRDLLHRAAAKSDSIIHLAARPSVAMSVKDPITANEVNVAGTLHVLEEARHLNAHVTVASSSAVYGDGPELPKSETLRPMPTSPYAVSKLATEAYAISYHKMYDTEVLPLRFFNVYGPGQTADHAYAAVIPAFIDAALTSRPLTIFGDGTQTRDFVYVGTVAELISDAARNHISASDPLNLAVGTRHSLIELITILEAVLGREVKKTNAPLRPGDVKDSEADCTRLFELFPNLKPLSLEAGITQTIEWFQQGRAQDEQHP